MFKAQNNGSNSVCWSGSPKWLSISASIVGVRRGAAVRLCRRGGGGRAWLSAGCRQVRSRSTTHKPPQAGETLPKTPPSPLNTALNAPKYPEHYPTSPTHHHLPAAESWGLQCEEQTRPPTTGSLRCCPFLLLRSFGGDDLEI